MAEPRYDGPRDSGVLEEQSINDVRRDAGFSEVPSQGRIPELLEEVMRKIDNCHKRAAILEERIGTVLGPIRSQDGDLKDGGTPEMSYVATYLLNSIQGLDALAVRIDMLTDRVEL